MLHKSETPRHSVRVRTNAQTSRPGWRPARRPKTLARDIAASILAHRANGVERAPEMYTTDAETLREVERLLNSAS